MRTKVQRIFGAVIATAWLVALVVSAGPAGGAEGKLVNINTATAAQLAELKGIGPAKAEAIVTHRDRSGPFRSVDDLQQVRGIGPKLMEQLRPHVTVGEPDAPAAGASAQGVKK